VTRKLCLIDLLLIIITNTLPPRTFAAIRLKCNKNGRKQKLIEFYDLKLIVIDSFTHFQHCESYKNANFFSSKNKNKNTKERRAQKKRT
jgi:hypothetical protein